VLRLGVSSETPISEMCLTAMPDELANYLALNLGMVPSRPTVEAPVCDQLSVRGRCGLRQVQIIGHRRGRSRRPRSCFKCDGRV